MKVQGKSESLVASQPFWCRHTRMLHSLLRLTSALPCRAQAFQRCGGPEQAVSHHPCHLSLSWISINLVQSDKKKKKKNLQCTLCFLTFFEFECRQKHLSLKGLEQGINLPSSETSENLEQESLMNSFLKYKFPDSLSLQLRPNLLGFYVSCHW